jgi:O-acetyl-ADP-ribose deacetylase (regulator of RNase III)
MRVTVKVGNIVDERVDVLVSTGNVQLNMSGGVNGELLLRGGRALQEELHHHLRERKIRYVAPGTVLKLDPGPFPFKSVLYAVAVDAWYESSVDLARQTIETAMGMASEMGAASVALPALATGYGNLKVEEFGRALREALEAEYPGVQELRVVVRREDQAAAIRKEISIDA